MDAEVKTNLKEIFKSWGKYQFKGNFIMLYDNESLRDPEFLQLCKDHETKIQLDLFTPIPNDKK